MSRHAHVVQLTEPVSDRDHSVGPSDAPLTLLEYGDYECPHCGRAFPIVQDVRRRMGDQLRFVFRNFPLTQIHEHAEHAAEVAEAAAAQGKFWPMHDWLFRHQFALDDETLLEGAQDLKLDVERVRRELANGTYRSRVRADFSTGIKSGVNGTPTFYINGVRHDGDFSADTLMAALGEALHSSGVKHA
ncbi:MAG TPA: DsbA family protein [Gemmatimonadales bacterium]|nr:DsbA family protein [Gemmatimonadales bacterium]